MQKQQANYRKAILPGGLIIFICISILILGSQVSTIYTHFRSILGPAFIGLLGLTVLFVSSLFQVFFKKSEEKLPTTSLTVVQLASPTVGLLGTIISIQNGFKNLDLGAVALEKAINQITITLGMSLSTTVYGMILSLCAMIVILVFVKPPLKKKKAAHR